MREARAAWAAAWAVGCSVTLISAPGGGAHGGGGWFRAVVRAAEVEVGAQAVPFGSPSPRVTAILDCADLPGCAQAAIRAGVPDIRFTGPPEVTAKLAAIAAAAGVRLHGADAFAGPCLDLCHETDPEAACRRWLARPDQDSPHSVDGKAPGASHK